MGAAEIAQRNDADQLFVAAHHRNAPNLTLLHLIGDFGDVLVVIAAQDVARHHVADGGVGAKTLSHAAHRDVAIGEHSDNTAAFADRSEEHTSELQSLMRISYAVFCLKKKK